MGSRICRAKIFPPVTDLTDLSDRGGRIGFAKRVVRPEPERYLNSNAPADSFNIIGYPRFNAKAWHASAGKRHA
jgi:hypothetical protein